MRNGLHTFAFTKINELLKKVGPDYAHAEARKSPALDGKVERDKDGKEVRYPVILSAKEKAIARQGKCFFFVDKFLKYRCQISF